MVPYTGNILITQAYSGTQHLGVDLVGMDNKNILSIGNGKVVYSGVISGFGNTIIIKQDDYYILYGHLSKINVKKDILVNAGDKIGVEGSTGYSTGSHLHLEVLKSFNGYYNRNISNTVNVADYLEIINRRGYISNKLIDRSGTNIDRNNYVEKKEEIKVENDTKDIISNIKYIGTEIKTDRYEKTPVKKDLLQYSLIGIIVIAFFAGYFFYKILKNKRRK